MLGVEYLTSEPHSVGSERVVRTKTMNVHERFTVYEPAKRWTFYLKRATLPLTSRFMEDYHLSPLDGGRCRLEWRVHYKTRRWIRPLAPLIRPIFARMFRVGIENLETWLTEHQE